MHNNKIDPQKSSIQNNKSNEIINKNMDSISNKIKLNTKIEHIKPLVDNRKCTKVRSPLYSDKYIQDINNISDIIYDYNGNKYLSMIEYLLDILKDNIHENKNDRIRIIQDLKKKTQLIDIVKRELLNSEIICKNHVDMYNKICKISDENKPPHFNIIQDKFINALNNRLKGKVNKYEYEDACKIGSWLIRKQLKEKLYLLDKSLRNNCFIFTAVSAFSPYNTIKNMYNKLHTDKQFGKNLNTVFDYFRYNKARKASSLPENLHEWVMNNKKDILTVLLYEFITVLNNSTDIITQYNICPSLLLFTHAKFIKYILDIPFDKIDFPERVLSLLEKECDINTIKDVSLIENNPQHVKMNFRKYLRNYQFPKRLNAKEDKKYIKHADDEYMIDPISKKMVLEEDIRINIQKIKDNIIALKKSKFDRPRNLFNADYVNTIEDFIAEFSEDVKHHESDSANNLQFLQKKSEFYKKDLKIMETIRQRLSENTTYDSIMDLFKDLLTNNEYDRLKRKLGEKFVQEKRDQLKRAFGDYHKMNNTQLIKRYENQLRIYEDHVNYPKYHMKTLMLSSHVHVLNLHNKGGKWDAYYVRYVPFKREGIDLQNYYKSPNNFIPSVAIFDKV